MATDNVIRARIGKLLFGVGVVFEPREGLPKRYHVKIPSEEADMSDEKIGAILKTRGRDYLTLPWLGPVIKAARAKGIGVTINGSGPRTSVWVGSIHPVLAAGNLRIAPRDNLIPKTLCEMILVWAQRDEHSTTEGTIETSANPGG